MRKYLLFNLNVIYLILFFTCIGWPGIIDAQTSYLRSSGSVADSLMVLLDTIPEDTNKLDVYKKLSEYYAASWPDSAIQYANEGLKLAYKLKVPRKQIDLLAFMSIALGEKGNFSLGLEQAFRALEIAKEIGDNNAIRYCNSIIGAVYFYAEDYRNALIYAKENQADQKYFRDNMGFKTGFLGETYYNLGEYDSALIYTKQSYDLYEAAIDHWAVPYLYMGKLSELKGRFNEALSYYKASISKPVALADYIKGYLAISSAFKKTDYLDSSIYYAKLAYRISKNTSLYSYSYQASELLKSLYKQTNQLDSAFKYQELMLAEKESLFNREKLNQIQNITYQDEKRQDEIEAAKLESRNRIRINALLGSSFTLLVVAFMLFRNNRLKQKAKQKIEKAYDQLKSTQSQLIQSEKMASLGELTSGIAHEIQNPLNFVNNFSEVNDELIVELKEEMKNGNIQKANQIADDIRENEQKIKHHGKRAEGIVKGMLQHSRTSQGEKEPTDLNALVDEYLRLTYHGFRAKDTNFNIDFKTDFDESMPKIEVVPQDIGRVLLNLINNAFYASSSKAFAKEDKDYKPLVTVSTQKLDDRLEINVKDNGPGIPSGIKEKIFQPFFTTKPSGKGTGLGLSLSYDIIKAHGGEIKVESIEGEGTEFIINLPIGH